MAETEPIPPHVSDAPTPAAKPHASDSDFYRISKYWVFDRRRRDCVYHEDFAILIPDGEKRKYEPERVLVSLVHDSIRIWAAGSSDTNDHSIRQLKTAEPHAVHPLSWDTRVELVDCPCMRRDDKTHAKTCQNSNSIRYRFTALAHDLQLFTCSTDAATNWANALALLYYERAAFCLMTTRIALAAHIDTAARERAALRVSAPNSSSDQLVAAYLVDGVDDTLIAAERDTELNALTDKVASVAAALETTPLFLKHPAFGQMRLHVSLRVSSSNTGCAEFYLDDRRKKLYCRAETVYESFLSDGAICILGAFPPTSAEQLLLSFDPPQQLLLNDLAIAVQLVFNLPRIFTHGEPPQRHAFSNDSFVTWSPNRSRSITIPDVEAAAASTHSYAEMFPILASLSASRAGVQAIDRVPATQPQMSPVQKELRDAASGRAQKLRERAAQRFPQTRTSHSSDVQTPIEYSPLLTPSSLSGGSTCTSHTKSAAPDPDDVPLRSKIMNGTPTSMSRARDSQFAQPEGRLRSRSQSMDLQSFSPEQRQRTRTLSIDKRAVPSPEAGRSIDESQRWTPTIRHAKSAIDLNRMCPSGGIPKSKSVADGLMCRHSLSHCLELLSDACAQFSSICSEFTKDVRMLDTEDAAECAARASISSSMLALNICGSLGGIIGSQNGGGKCKECETPKCEK